MQEKRQTAPAAGRVTDVFLRPGEWANAAQPVLALLPPHAAQGALLCPKASWAACNLGDAVRLACDGWVARPSRQGELHCAGAE